MTNAEALDVINNFKDMASVKLLEFSYAALRADDALRKQIPRPPKDGHHCPRCGFGLPVEGVQDYWCRGCFYPNYCMDCGQALDWRQYI